MTYDIRVRVAVSAAAVCALIVAQQASAQQDKLLDAVRRDDMRMVQALLETGADVDARDDNLNATGPHEVCPR